MANFDLSIDSNGSAIKYFDNSTHFICTWENVYLQDQREIGAFTFQVILQNTGKIISLIQDKIKNLIVFLKEIFISIIFEFLIWIFRIIIMHIESVYPMPIYLN